MVMKPLPFIVFYDLYDPHGVQASWTNTRQILDERLFGIDHFAFFTSMTQHIRWVRAVLAQPENN